MIKPRIKNLTCHAEFDVCVGIQKKVWKHSSTNLTPSHQLCVAVETGSILLGAFIEGRMAGFVYSFPAVFNGRLCQHSHLLAVLPQYQGCGLGKTLKWAQRSEALRLGYDLMTWTFDPLQVRNAGLNLHTLGAESRTYLPNFYGRVPSLVFTQGLDSDRLKMEWILDSRRVGDRQKRVYPRFDPAREAKALEGRRNGGRLEPRTGRGTADARRLLVEIPMDLKKFRHEPAYVLRWQDALRRTLSRRFARGWRLTDFLFGERCYYVLERNA
jgi:predicted GNAT superfamily acetyltransferase